MSRSLQERFMANYETIDLRLGINCPGCDRELTIVNVGGYRQYCHWCVEAMPPFPADGNARGGCVIEGKYPKFRWVCDDL